MMKLREIRDERGFTRKFVAEKLGISPNHLTNLELGYTKLGLLKIEKLSQVYGVSIEEMEQIAKETYKGR